MPSNLWRQERWVDIRKYETSNPLCSGHPKVQPALSAKRDGQERGQSQDAF